MTGRSPRNLIVAALRDPLTHFIVAGGILFGAFWLYGPKPEVSQSDSTKIVITADDLRQMALVWLSQGREAPTVEEMKNLAHQEAVQRVLVREAKEMGLDQDDEIIDRRLAQKMDFLMADLSSLGTPDDAGLKDWYLAHPDRFQMPPRASFRHVYVSQDKRGADGAKSYAETLLPQLASLGPDDPALSGMADRFMFQDYYGSRSPLDVAKEFGPDFADALFKLEPGRWQGPIRSGYGWHLVWIESLEPAHLADFDTVKEAVKAAYLDDRYREVRDRAYADMLSRYTIEVTDPATVDLSPAAIGQPAPLPDIPLVGQ